VPHPTGHEGKQGEPEQQVHVGPQDAAGDALGHREHVVVVVPVDAEVGEAQNVGQKNRLLRPQSRQTGAVRRAQLEHADRDDDGQHAVAERFEPVLAN
jgi:hypothetical protein